MLCDTLGVFRRSKPRPYTVQTQTAAAYSVSTVPGGWLTAVSQQGNLGSDAFTDVIPE